MQLISKMHNISCKINAQNSASTWATYIATHLFKIPVSLK